MDHLAQIIFLLAVTLTTVVIFQRLHIPTALGYLLAGVILGPFTFGPTVHVPEFAVLAEFGVVFLLFTIGLDFSLPKLHAMRHQVLGLGSGQVVLTTALVTLILWLAGMSATAAFVFGAIFAQSSSTIISSLLTERGEENSPQGRLGLAISVFQDVTAVPFLVVIPVLGCSASATGLASSLGWALGEAILAFALVFLACRWLLRPLFHAVSERKSSEMFTLAVLLVALLAAWTTNSFGLSLAFGGFLAGMMLGETEFRHQVESSIRPFRDVLLGMFFIGIGMRFDLAAIPPIWHWALLGALLIITSKIFIVTLMLRVLGKDPKLALQTGLLLSVGGEFGFALIAIAMDASVIDSQLGQIAISSVLLSMIAGAFLIRYSNAIAKRLTPTPRPENTPTLEELPNLSDHQVVIGGYGKVGHTVAVLLHSKGIPFVAFDTKSERVAQGRKDGFQVFYGDIADPDMLATIHIDQAPLLVITVDRPAEMLKAISYVRKNCPQVPIIARAQDISHSQLLIDAGVTHVYPEAVEASLRLGAAALKVLNVTSEEIDQVLQGVRDWGYKPVLVDKKAKPE